MKLRFSEADLTVGDLEDIEEYTGQQFTGIKITKDEDGKFQADVSSKLLTAIIWITQRHENPDFTVEDARKVKITEMELDPGDSDPTPAAGANGSARSRRSATSGK